MDTNLNIRHLLIISLGYNSYLHEEIDRFYEKKRWDYYETFKNSGFYDDLVIKSFSSIREEKMRKVAGMVEWCYKHDDFQALNHLMKKGYKDVFRYYEQNKAKLSLEGYMNYVSKREKEGTKTEMDYYMRYIVLLYLSYKDGLNIGRLFSTDFGQIVAQGITDLFFNTGAAYLSKEKLKKTEKDAKNAEEYIKEAFELDVNKTQSFVLDTLFDNVINTKAQQKMEQMSRIVDIQVQELNRIRSEMFLNGITKYMGAYTSVMNLSELNCADLLDIEISTEDLVMYAHNALMRQSGNQFDEDEVNQIFIASLFMHALFTHYKDQKQNLINDSNEAWYVDVKMREQQLSEKERFFEKTKNRLEIEVEEERRKKKNYEAENNAIRKEIEKLRKETQDFREEREELIELRNFVYRQGKKDVQLSEDTVQDAISQLKDMRLVVCGGHPNMQKKLKQLVPNLELMSTDSLGKNFTHLRNFDAVFFYPNYANHAFYKKIKSALQNSDVRFVYLDDIDNVELVLMNMYDNVAMKGLSR